MLLYPLLLERWILCRPHSGFPRLSTNCIVSLHKIHRWISLIFCLKIPWVETNRSGIPQKSWERDTSPSLASLVSWDENVRFWECDLFLSTGHCYFWVRMRGGEKSRSLQGHIYHNCRDRFVSRVPVSIYHLANSLFFFAQVPYFTGMMLKKNGQKYFVLERRHAKLKIPCHKSWSGQIFLWQDKQK